MDLNEKTSCLPLFQGIAASDIALLRSVMGRVEYPPDTIILMEGGEPKGFHLIQSGEVRVVKNHGRRTAKDLNLLTAGDFFGEMSLIDDSPPSATVIAVSEVICLVFSPEAFSRLIDTQPTISRILLGNLCRRIRKSETTGLRELLDAQEAVIMSLAKLVEFRDPETGAHLDRIRIYCRLLAGLAKGIPDFAGQIDDEFVEMIYMASPLHDVGKVGIPDSVLLKPGPLTPDEFEIMKEHAAIGADTIKRALDKIAGGSFLVMGHRIAQNHHENFDGSGYPRGIRGEEIPLSARIMAVADVYDALRSPRVYRGPLPHTEARRILAAGRGQKFDPQLLDLFLAQEAEFIAIHEETKDRGDDGT